MIRDKMEKAEKNNSEKEQEREVREDTESGERAKRTWNSPEDDLGKKKAELVISKAQVASCLGCSQTQCPVAMEGRKFKSLVVLLLETEMKNVGIRHGHSEVRGGGEGHGEGL